MRPTTKIDELLKAVKQAVIDDRIPNAIALIERARQLDPDYVPTLVWLGSVEQERGNWARSIEIAEDILAKNPDEAQAYSLLADAYKALNQWDRAYDAFSNSNRLAPTPARLVLEGTAARMLGDQEAARKCYQEALLLEPTYDEALFNLGVALGSDDPDRAEELLLRLIAIEPKNAAAHRELGFVYARTRKVSQARTILEKSLAMEDNAWTRAYLGAVFWDQGELERSEAEYERAHHLEPAIGALDILANAYDRVGDHKKADSIRKRLRNADQDRRG